MEFITIEAVEFSLLFTSLVFSLVTLLFAGKMRLAKALSFIGAKDERRENTLFDYYISHILNFIILALAISSGAWKINLPISILVFGVSAVNLLIASIQVKEREDYEVELKQPLVIVILELMSAVIISGYCLVGMNTII